MSRCTRIVGLGLAGFLAAAPAMAQSPTPPSEPTGMVLDRVVAVVNDEALTLSEIQEEGQPVIRKIFKDFVGPERDRRVEEAEKRLMDDLIERRLAVQVAKKEGMMPSSAEVTGAIEELKKNNNATDDAQFRALLRAEGMTYEQVRRTVEERLAISRTLARQIRSAIIIREDELTQYYQDHPDKYPRIPEAEIRHILVAVPPGSDGAAAKARAEEVLARLKAGADFSKMAEQYSDSPTKDKGGELGAIHRGDLAPEIEAAAFGLPVGGVSELIRTPAGWNIIKVERVRTETVAPFAEVRESIRDEVFQEKFEVKRKEWLAALRAKAFIQVIMEPGALKTELQKTK
ncbi:MAG TPA: peptidylprolyl isomerase [Candidatus Methylomirabilis sp.]|nr:peptidylprolyl isomerase [Candidatus Methylomirabilis sp.]